MPTAELYLADKPRLSTIDTLLEDKARVEIDVHTTLLSVYDRNPMLVEVLHEFKDEKEAFAHSMDTAASVIAWKRSTEDNDKVHNFSTEEFDALIISALLHDLGKRNILVKTIANSDMRFGPESKGRRILNRHGAYGVDELRHIVGDDGVSDSKLVRETTEHVQLDHQQQAQTAGEEFEEACNGIVSICDFVNAMYDKNRKYPLLTRHPKNPKVFYKSPRESVEAMVTEMILEEHIREEGYFGMSLKDIVTFVMKYEEDKLASSVLEMEGAISKERVPNTIILTDSTLQRMGGVAIQPGGLLVRQR